MSAPRAGRARFAAAIVVACTLGVPGVDADERADGGAVDAARNTDADAAGGGLATLRLFVSPERRAALDGDGRAGAPAPAKEASAPARADAGPDDDAIAMETRSAQRGRPAPRPGAPPPGSATLRSVHGTSRIVDGVPLRAGPP